MCVRYQTLGLDKIMWGTEGRSDPNLGSGVLKIEVWSGASVKSGKQGRRE